MRVLIIGPSVTDSKGGMASVTQAILNDAEFNKECQIDTLASYVDGNKIMKLFCFFAAYLKLLWIMHRYDVFHIQMASNASCFRKIYFIRILKFFHKTVVVQIHGGYFDRFFIDLPPRKQRYIIKNLKKVDLLLSLSELIKQKLIKVLGIADIAVLHNGVDVSRYQICQTAGNCVQFLFLGTLNQSKGVYDLLQSIRLLVNYGIKPYVYFAGDGEIDKVKGQIKEEQIEDYCRITGWANLQGELELLKKVSTVILPSYAEALPVCLIEGMAAGKVIISTPVGGIPELVENGKNGYLVRPGDPQALADAMRLVMEQPGKDAEMGAVNIKKIERNYSSSKVHEQLLKYYQSVSNSGGH